MVSIGSSPSKPRKKIINEKESVVDEALDGLCMMNPHLVRIKGTKVITLRERDPNAVALVCGGGSGHEPAHAGFVDGKLLTAAVCGNVFASPPVTEIQAAVHHVCG